MQSPVYDFILYKTNYHRNPHWGKNTNLQEALLNKDFREKEKRITTGRFQIHVPFSSLLSAIGPYNDFSVYCVRVL
jgi:hypothetical protein